MITKIRDKRKLGVWYSEDEVFDYGVAKHVGGSALLVYFALCRHANNEGKAFPSIKLLMEECDLSNRVVAKSTRILKRLGLIEIEREKHQYNVYYVKSIKAAIALNNWQKIASDEKSPIQKQVTKSHLASDEKSLGQVTKSHLASDEKSHEGLTIEGHTIEGQTTEGHMDTEHGKNENPCKTCVHLVRQSSVDLNVFSSLNWPKNLNKTQPVAVALAKLPDNYARQQVLDVLAQASEKGTVDKPVAFLQGVVKNYLNGDFTPIEKAPAQAPAQPTSRPDVQPQNHANDRSVSEANEKDKIDQLKQAFHENRRGQVEKMMEGWDEQTRASEMAEFKKATNHTVQTLYQKHGLDSRLVKSTLTDYLAKKYLPVEVSDFVAWAKTQGYQVESNDNGNGNGNGTNGSYRLNSTKPVSHVLEGVLSNIEHVNGR